jgi:hypothetical protein
LIEQAAYATLVGMGQSARADALRLRLASVERTPLQPGSYFHLLSFQSRALLDIARGDLGSGFDDDVDEFCRLVRNPRDVHKVACLYYNHVAHARVSQCQRASKLALPTLLDKLEQMTRCIEISQPHPTMAAHPRFLRAARAWFLGSRRKAELLLSESERLAEIHGCPWISCAAAHLRAHMLDADGKTQAAQDQARVAAMLAQQYGQHRRLLDIRHEFNLTDAFRDDGGLLTHLPARQASAQAG